MQTAPMSDVFYLRPLDPPISPRQLTDMANYAGNCFRTHRVDWLQSFLAETGDRMLCWYRAADAESARMALRELGSEMNAVWSGTVIGDEDKSPPLASVNVLAEVRLEQPRDDNRPDPGRILVTALTQRVDATMVRAFVSTSRTQLICVFRAASPEVVRSALAAAGLPTGMVWRCVAVTPDLPPVHEK